MKTNYFGHDRTYQRYKAEGRIGWGDADGYATSLAQLSQWFQSDLVPKRGKLLELGCGAGNVTLWLAQCGYDVSGVDIAPTAIAWAKERFSAQGITADLREGNVLDLQGYPDNLFDIVLDGHCLHCIIGEDRHLFFMNAQRVLKPGGVLLVDTMCGEVTNKEMQQHFDPNIRCLVYGDILSRYIGLPDEIVTEIQQAGFTILQWNIQARKDEDDCDGLFVIAAK